jgi:DNA polymerase-3 subunit delta
MDSLTFLEQIGKSPPLPVYVIHGDEDFLKRQVITALKAHVLDGGDETFGASNHPGDKAVWADVHGELLTLPFLSPRRLVVIDSAEPFVTAWRAQLEKYLAAPAASGVLVLDVKSWPSNTRLYKLVGTGAISCKALAGQELAAWCRHHASSHHKKQLQVPAAQLLVELVGADMGLLAQEIAKLAVYVGDAARIAPEDVDRLVGNSRAENTFEIFALIGKGDPAGALAFLDRLLGQGEDPMRLLGAFGWQLRRLAQAGRLAARGMSIPAALAEVGLYRAREAEQQLRHLGRRRLERVFDWLLEIDLGMKGGSQLPPRTLLERLVVRLALPNPPAPRPTPARQH